MKVESALSRLAALCMARALCVALFMALCMSLGACAASRHPAASPQALATANALDTILASPQRSPTSRARDGFLHPKDTLLFFGVRPQMSVVEVWPGAGWYTEILAPLLRERGELRTALLDSSAGAYPKSIDEAFRSKLAASPDLFGKVQITTLTAPPGGNAIAPPSSADLVLAYCNLHTWMKFGWERDVATAMYTALKPGGVLGIVDHRGNPKVPQDPRAISGYVNQDYAIELMRSVGFELVGASEVNANPRDTKDYASGVWALPPDFADGARNRDRYSAIGASDRFTLKFRKPRT